MHQFTDSDDLGSIIPALKRAKRQAFGEGPRVEVTLNADTDQFIESFEKSRKALRDSYWITRWA